MSQPGPLSRRQRQPELFWGMVPGRAAGTGTPGGAGTASRHGTRAQHPGTASGHSIPARSPPPPAAPGTAAAPGAARSEGSELRRRVRAVAAGGGSRGRAGLAAGAGSARLSAGNIPQERRGGSCAHGPERARRRGVPRYRARPSRPGHSEHPGPASAPKGTGRSLEQRAGGPAAPGPERWSCWAGWSRGRGVPCPRRSSGWVTGDVPVSPCPGCFRTDQV